jgi:hypothetical protein
MLLIALMLQATAVGETVSPTVVRVREVHRVGQRLTVDYEIENRSKTRIPVPVPPVTITDPAGRSLPVGKPSEGDAPKSVKTEIEPGLTVGQSVSVDLGQNITATVYGMNPKTYNESTWYFVVGGDRVPFSF